MKSLKKIYTVRHIKSVQTGRNVQNILRDIIVQDVRKVKYVQNVQLLKKNATHQIKPQKCQQTKNKKGQNYNSINIKKQSKVQIFKCVKGEIYK